MRRYTLYKQYKHKFISLYFLKKYFLHFKRPKWRFLKKRLLPFFVFSTRVKDRFVKAFFIFRFRQKNFYRRKLLRGLFVSFSHIKKRLCRFERSCFFFDEQLRVKNCLRANFDAAFSTSYFKKYVRKNSTRTYLLQSFLLRPEFRIDVLLWRTFFFSSVYAASFAINAGKVLINYFPSRINFFVKAGDIISLCDKKKYCFKSIFSTYCMRFLRAPFVEIDYYLRKIIITHSFCQISLSDFITCVHLPVDIQKIKNYYLH